MRFPVIASVSAYRAWSVGVALAWLPLATVFLPLPFASELIPVSVAILALYALTVRPRAFAASGVLLGTAPFFAWGVLDGLQKCARFNRSGPNGGCESDPSTQVAITVVVYVVALVVTGYAMWSSVRDTRS